jgi:hypothetical protein
MLLGLFEEDMLAGLQRIDGNIGVLVPHGHDRHRIDVGIAIIMASSLNLINGYTGAIAGKYPLSAVKILLLVVVILLGALGIFAFTR